MPELPEVETVRRDLAPQLVGRRLGALWTSGKPLRLGRPLDVAALAAATDGSRVVDLRRLGKYLALDTEAGTLVVHLGMTGRLWLAAPEVPRPPHTHAVWLVDDGRELRFTDPRRFGYLGVEAPAVGADPLTITARAFSQVVSASRRAIKALLLDQSRLGGVGNIYACEALHLAGIHPRARADRLVPRRVRRLRGALVRVLAQGIANRGTTVRDYVDGEGRAGRNQHVLRVYGREGEACLRGDGGRVRRLVDQGRSTFYCPRCQTR